MADHGYKKLYYRKNGSKRRKPEEENVIEWQCRRMAAGEQKGEYIVKRIISLSGIGYLLESEKGNTTKPGADLTGFRFRDFTFERSMYGYILVCMIRWYMSNCKKALSLPCNNSIFPGFCQESGQNTNN
jgi:hypothetical protein